jgi:phage terminase Nu1 subunit (DNA packaging protein)
MKLFKAYIKAVRQRKAGNVTPESLLAEDAFWDAVIAWAARKNDEVADRADAEVNKAIEQQRLFRERMDNFATLASTAGDKSHEVYEVLGTYAKG